MEGIYEHTEPDKEILNIIGPLKQDIVLYVSGIKKKKINLVNFTGEFSGTFEHHFGKGIKLLRNGSSISNISS